MLETFVFYESPIGKLAIASNKKAITRLAFPGELWCKEMPRQTDPLLALACAQLDEYFSAERQLFELPFQPRGTVFQQKVWRALLQIPYGTTCSYKEVASWVGNPKAARAIGGAVHANPIAIMIPCHRVVGADGSLTGFGGGLERKKFLLNLEQRHLR